MSSLQRQHADLYGLLLAADQSVNDAGTAWLMISALIVTLGSIFGLQVAWYDDVLGRDLSEARHWGTYVGMLATGFIAFGASVELCRTADDEALGHVVAHLRKDSTGRRTLRSQSIIATDGAMEP